MPKWLGNRFGNAVPINPGGPGPSAIYNMFDQYYMKQEGGYIKTVFAGSGGTKVTYGGVVYHTFTTSGAFAVTEAAGLTNATISLLVQGAGGGGGMIGGGGGAGGQVDATGVQLPTSAGPFPVVIGTGGACSTGAGTRGSDGGDTTFNTPTTNLVTATGGGGGGSHQSGSNSIGGNPGGCGGGGSDNSGTGPHSYGTSNQPTSSPLESGATTFNFYGNRGGTGAPSYSSPPRGGGGGGGTGAAGGNFPGRTGGQGRPYTIPTKDTPTTQTTYWFGGGGGGSPYENDNPAPGGRGGGGGGWNDDPGGAALAPGGADGYGGDVNSNPTTPTPNEAGGRAATNSGGGGGGCRWGGHQPGLVTGGPGIVVISYPNDLG